MRIASLFLVSLLACQSSFAKSVDVQTAKTVGANFFKNEGVNVDPSGMSLAYKAVSFVNNTPVTDFYVFNNSTSAGFVIVSADDIVIPILGYSSESAFDAATIPASVSEWLDIYKNQIAFIVNNKETASERTVAEWNTLLQTTGTRAGHKTTAKSVAPLLKTLWSQSPYVNDLCPYDATAGDKALTGCVATAMVQVMKYWKWPAQGVSSHSYNSPYGLLSANFATANYKWDSMPAMITKANSFVATVMSHAGIGVNMNYGVDASGAYVLSSYSPVTNCAEYALVKYFNYKPTIKGIYRNDFSDTDWVSAIKADLDWRRPVIYSGYGSTGGHCFIADGYADANRLHINWGWGGAYNGYFVFDDLSTTTSDFNSNQALLTGIEPNNPATLGVGQAAATVFNIYPNPSYDVVNISLQGVKTDKISVTDMQGRIVRVITPAAYAQVATVPVNDLAAGLYVVSIATEQGTETKQIVVAK